MAISKQMMQQLVTFQNGTNPRAYQLLGAHKAKKADREGFVLRTWAPNARTISVVGDFNGWDRRKTPMRKYADFGVWEVFVPGLQEYDTYKYSIEGITGKITLKSDPLPSIARRPPKRLPSSRISAASNGPTSDG